MIEDIKIEIISQTSTENQKLFTDRVEEKIKEIQADGWGFKDAKYALSASESDEYAYIDRDVMLIFSRKRNE